MATGDGQQHLAVSTNRARYDKLQFRARVFVVVALSAVAMATPYIGERRFHVAALLSLIVLPLHFAIRKVTGTPNPTGWLDLVAVGAATATVAIEPTAFAPAFLFQLVHLAAAVPYLTVRWSRALSLFSMVTMTGVALAHQIGSVAIPMLLIATVLLPAVLTGAKRKRVKDKRNSERIASIANSLPTVLWEADQDGGMLAVFGSPERVLQTPVHELLGKGYLSHIDTRDQPNFKRRFTNGERTSLRYRFVASNQKTMWLTDKVEEVEQDGKKLLRGITIDVTELQRAQETVTRQSEIVDRMSAATIVLANEQPTLKTDGPSDAAMFSRLKIISASDPLGDFLESPHDAIGMTMGRALPELAAQAWLSDGISRLEPGGTVMMGPHRILRGHARSLVVEIQTFSMPDQTTALIIENVTDRENAQDTVRYQASHDSLTALPNRVALMDAMEHRLREELPFTLALLDLNRFKAVNDALGHLTGDRLLQVVAQRLNNALSNGDLVSRLGGDEFAILFAPSCSAGNDLPDGHSESADLDRRIAGVIAACRDRVTISGSTVSVGVSIGLADAHCDGSDPETLLRHADLAMYEAKRSRDPVRHYKSTPERGSERLDLMTELETAFADQQFVPFFQPKFEAATGKIIGAEALARWVHPTRGVLLPADFMELIAVSGRLDDLLHSILWSAARTASELPSNIHIALNLSAVNLRKADITETFTKAIDTFDVNPSRLTVELTESEFMDETGRIEMSLRELSELGLGVAVDDFGTGYSSLSHLRNLPLTELKVDRQFVSPMVHSPQDRVVVKALVGLAHDLGLTLTAEGVEDTETLDLLNQMGCDTVQGFLLGRPLPIAELIKLLPADHDQYSLATESPDLP